MGMVALSGCDTVARISFPDVKFDKVEVAGMTPPPDSCKGSSGNAKLRFVLLDNQQQPITPDTTLNGQAVSLTRESVELSQTAAFSLPDVECSGMCAQSNFSCDRAQMNFEANLSRCFQEGGIGINSAPQFVSDLKANQLFGVVVENTGSLQGQLPSNLTVRYPDFDGDGKGEAPGELQGLVRERASDFLKVRVAGLTQMATTWKIIEQFSSTNNQVQNFFGMWTFANSPGSIESVIGSSVWTGSPDAVDAALRRFPQTTNSSQASVFESLITILKDTNAYANPQFAAYEKVMVVFVDGPDELRLQGSTAAEVIAAANAVNARLFIVHLDAKLATETTAGSPLFVDDPEYIKFQDPCMDDSTCKNFEVCKEITKFSSAEGGAATFPDKATPGTKFCMPQRDDNGRIGPVDDYSEIACATGGSYVYVKDARALAFEMTWLPYVLDGLWEADINVDLFSRTGSVADGQPYLFQTNMSVSLGDVRTVEAVSQKGTVLGTDNRLVLFKNQ